MNDNYNQTIEEILNNNNGVITREEIINVKIPSVAFTRYLKKNESIIKIAPGVYAKNNFTIDDLFLLQKRYPRIVYSGLTSLYLNKLYERIPDFIEFTIPKSYRVRKKSISNSIIVHIENNFAFYDFGNVKIETIFKNLVTCYCKEKAIVEMIRKRDEYDAETFIKALRLYLNTKDKNMHLLFQFAKMRKIEKKVYEIMEIISNEY